MLIFRYLAKEVFITLVSLTSILMLIFMSNQFVRYLNRAASGNIPGVIIMKLMMLELPTLIGLLLPLGFYVALLIAYGRLYAESEMTVLRACGYSSGQLLKHSFIMATVVAVIVALIMIWASPGIAVERAKLLRSSGVQTLIQTIVPGRFQAVSGGKHVFYVESMSRDHTKAKHIFLAGLQAKNTGLQWDVLWADKAYAETDPQTSEDYIVLHDGKEYEGVPGQASYQVAEFKQYKARLPHPVIAVNKDIRTVKTSELWPLNNSDKAKAAELQWRFSVPIMVLTLTLIAVPLSRVNPRAGKFAKLLPAIVIYIIYANFMFIGRDAMMDGKIPVWVGMWWLHLSVLALGFFLVWRNRIKMA
ncbi:LPS export ABC transporter permease LptF [Legionella israelensis]|uniref:Lipopolysaccharide export system permease protein LptF n=1 Tax=Legionella israelensis TaxID=454 RepID=A0AAX1EE21_9GAMM|nr:LPS export ABC transporter permease LptF [Legionella israelensis]QBR83353.1 LPS export ABC transporter permease LptF [Legionella israelensis]QDP71879.1 LPS export ABC transporter permease LptF [Legionella israelensis]